MQKAKLAKRILPLIDLTSLNSNDDETSIANLCQSAATPFGNVASVCVYSKFATLAKQLLNNTGIKVACVCNFPSGNNLLADVSKEIEQTLVQGADEIDLVIPYQAYLAGNKTIIQEWVKACKHMCGTNILLKVILETGAMQNNAQIAAASKAAINSGADFIKTSTGKYPVGATLEAAKVMLETIKDSQPRRVGFKAAGGIRTTTQALDYLQLADTIMGENWVTPKTFRFGASQLLGDTLKKQGDALNI